MKRDELANRCRRVMLQLDTHDETAAMNAGDMLADLLSELTGPVPLAKAMEDAIDEMETGTPKPKRGKES